MLEESLISEGLNRPTTAITYEVSRRLAELFPERAMLEAPLCAFDLVQFASCGYCSLTPKATVHQQISTVWRGSGEGLAQEATNAWFEIDWQGDLLEIVLISWKEMFELHRHCWILSDDRAVGERFFETVSEWSIAVRDEVAVFDGGGWTKDGNLYHSIQSSTFDNLVLPKNLKHEVEHDAARFFASQETYQRYNVPWKRGVLFTGPPGNGKTHAVKALVNATARPCLYVKSFKSQYSTDHDGIRTVFQRCRQSAPCILVLEDLDSLIDDENRAFFLNELDGFAANVGVFTLATTNHPERLDPAIVDRPSRFDRKYHFPLPAAGEREAYTRWWNSALEPELQLSPAGIERMVELTEGFSFAYLKELFLSATMKWIAAAQPGSMDVVMAEQVLPLRQQMASEPDTMPRGRLARWLKRGNHQAVNGAIG